MAVNFLYFPLYTLLVQKSFKSENFKVQRLLLYMECHDLSALKTFGLKFWKMLLLLAFCPPPPSLLRAMLNYEQFLEFF